MNRDVEKLVAYMASKNTIQDNIRRQRELGAVQAEWVFLRTACNHEVLGGTVFNLSEGVEHEGECIFPGQSIDCGCRHAPIFPYVS